MHDAGLMSFISFSGHIGLDTSHAPIDFRARIANTGEVEFEFETMVVSPTTIFIYEQWDSDRRNLCTFTLSGASETGIRLHTDDLSFTSMRQHIGKAVERTMTPTGSCVTAHIHRKLAEPAQLPIVRMHLKGFQNFHQLRAECQLGIVTMDGAAKVENPDRLIGQIEVRPEKMPADMAEWRRSVDDLFEHIRRVMSFASAIVLHSPICEYFDGDEVEVVAWSQAIQSGASFRIIHYLDQTPIFAAAVASYFAPPIQIKNLFHAIEWFAMDATYNEVQLVNAMTVLENLVASNLGDEAGLILDKKQFSKTRKVLRSVIRTCVDTWTVEHEKAAAEIVAELDERLGDLNRRSIFNKLMLLVDRWSVPLDGIDEAQIKAAKKARDLIVHMGHYEKDKDDELWDHVMLVRELVVRFLFTAIGFKGRYISFVGGMHHTVFPPPANSNESVTA